ncbi:hypothetical protein JHN47_10650 [Streptomyces sp. MBT62]|nr:hypothetical protein [Streptomyces sp. MBT62]
MELNNARTIVLDWLDMPVGRLRNHLGVYPSSADMTASVISSASLSVGVIPMAGRHGASHGEAFNSSSIRA